MAILSNLSTELQAGAFCVITLTLVPLTIWALHNLCSLRSTSKEAEQAKAPNGELYGYSA